MADLKGLKRICMSCGARFYDLNKKPIICPSCSTAFTGEIKVKSRRGRLPADDAVEDQIDGDATENEAEEEIEEGDEETVSLDELDEEDEDADDDTLTIDDEDDLDIDDVDDLDDDEDGEDIAEDDEDDK